MVDWLFGQLVGLLVGQLDSWSAGWLLSWLISAWLVVFFNLWFDNCQLRCHCLGILETQFRLIMTLNSRRRAGVVCGEV